MNRALPALLICAFSRTARPRLVKTTRDQILFYTSDWHGERFPDGRPKLPTHPSPEPSTSPSKTSGTYPLTRSTTTSSRHQGPSTPPALRRSRLTTYLPARLNMTKAITAEGKAEVGRANNSWLSMTSRGRRLRRRRQRQGLQRHPHRLQPRQRHRRPPPASSRRRRPRRRGEPRDRQPQRPLSRLRPSFLIGMTMTAINTPIHGHTTVLPGDLVPPSATRHLHPRHPRRIHLHRRVHQTRAVQLRVNRSGQNKGEFEADGTPQIRRLQNGRHHPDKLDAPQRVRRPAKKAPPRLAGHPKSKCHSERGTRRIVLRPHLSPRRNLYQTTTPPGHN